MEGGGTLTVDVVPHPLDLGLAALDKHKADNQILACALGQLKVRKEKVVMVSKDTNLRIKADALGLQAEDYTTDRVAVDELYTGTAVWDVDPVKLDMLFDGGLVPDPRTTPSAPTSSSPWWTAPTSTHTALGRFYASDGRIHPLKRVEMPPWGVKPRNREQQFALELLLDDSVQVVTLLGKAGTGKTLLAIAAGLQQVVDEERFNKLLVSRPVMPMGRDLGFLPGDISEKLRPYMQPIYAATVMNGPFV